VGRVCGTAPIASICEANGIKPEAAGSVWTVASQDVVVVQIVDITVVTYGAKVKV
jgi:hypothetical protein